MSVKSRCNERWSYRGRHHCRRVHPLQLFGRGYRHEGAQGIHRRKLKARLFSGFNALLTRTFKKCLHHAESPFRDFFRCAGIDGHAGPDEHEGSIPPDQPLPYPFGGCGHASQMEAEVTEIRVNIDGTTQRRIKPTRSCSPVTHSRGIRSLLETFRFSFPSHSRKNFRSSMQRRLARRGFGACKSKLTLRLAQPARRFALGRLWTTFKSRPLGSSNGRLRRFLLRQRASGRSRSWTINRTAFGYHLFETTAGDITKAANGRGNADFHFARDDVWTTMRKRKSIVLHRLISRYLDLLFLPMVMTDGSRVPDVELVLTMGAAAKTLPFFARS